MRNRVVFDFLMVIEKRMEATKQNRSALAETLGVSRSSISQMFSEKKVCNFTLDRMLELCRALGLKLALVPYNDADPENEQGPIFSEVFLRCWEDNGKPHDFWKWSDEEDASAGRGNNSDTKTSSLPT